MVEPAGATLGRDGVAAQDDAVVHGRVGVDEGPAGVERERAIERHEHDSECGSWELDPNVEEDVEEAVTVHGLGDVGRQERGPFHGQAPLLGQSIEIIVQGMVDSAVHGWPFTMTFEKR